MHTMRVIDSHAHCGIQEPYPPQAFEDYLAAIRKSPISGVALFPPVAEIYDRHDPFFTDTPSWRESRKTANHYLTTLKNREIDVFPYFFIWNDFAVDQLSDNHYGIKWHRHDDEPRYNYDDPACQAAVQAIRKRNLPVVLEEELENTIRFVETIAPGLTVIIPHLGMLNGGYHRLASAGIWENPNVWADTALAPARDITEYIDQYGHHRLLFGSDFPFGHPPSELSKIRRLSLADTEMKDIFANNLMRLYEQIQRGI